MNYQAPVRKKIVQLLHKHGILQRRTLLSFLKQEASERSIDMNLALLRKSGCITKLSNQVDHRYIGMYCIRSTKDARDQAASLLKIPVESIRQKSLRYTHYFHEDACARIHEALNQALPQARILRAIDVNAEKLPAYLLPGSFKKNGEVPDLILELPAVKSSEMAEPRPIWIAVEVDRTRKQLDRIKRRLFRYAEKCSFDGVLYFVPTAQLAAQYEREYQSKVGHLVDGLFSRKDSYFARTVLTNDIPDMQKLFLQCGSKRISFTDWIQLISTIPAKDRDKNLHQNYNSTEILERA